LDEKETMLFINETKIREWINLYWL
jgi:hypothetical protein